MAVAQAQHALREMVDTLKKNDIKVTYAIHPVAGKNARTYERIIAEANVPYDEVDFELEDINNDFANSDVAFVIGANDVTNPVQKQTLRAQYLECQFLMLKNVSQFYLLKSLSPGYAGIDNELFYKDNTLVLFADAKKMTEDIVKNFRLMKTKYFVISLILKL